MICDSANPNVTLSGCDAFRDGRIRLSYLRNRSFTSLYSFLSPNVMDTTGEKWERANTSSGFIYDTIWIWNVHIIKHYSEGSVND